MAAATWILPSLRSYQRRWLGRDILAGISAGAVVIPQAMAYATIADLPAQVGLYTCIVPMLVYALLGGSRAMSVSTTSTIATLTATTFVSAGVVADSHDIPRDLVTLTLMVGVILGVARLLRLGGLVEIINRPTLIGIQVGVGATVALGQVPKLLGEDAATTGEGFIRSITAVVLAIPHANVATTVLAASSVVTLFVLKRVAPRVPAALIVVAAGIILSATGALSGAGVELIAPVPQGFPLPTLPSFENITALIPGAFAIAVMAFLESSAVARGIRDLGDPAISSNRELLATAAANIAGSFTQSLPAAGGFSQSAVNKNAGARSQLSALTTVALAILIGLFLGPVLSLLPQASLAALVFVAVFGLIDVRALARLRKVKRADFGVALAVTVVGLTAGLLIAVATGVVVTLVMVLRALNQPRIRTVRSDESTLNITLLAPLYTANVLNTEQAILAATDAQPLGVTTVVVDMTRIEETSVTVLDALEDLDRELGSRNIRLELANLPDATARTASGTSWYAALVEQGRANSVGKENRDDPRP